MLRGPNDEFKDLIPLWIRFVRQPRAGFPLMADFDRDVRIAGVEKARTFQIPRVDEMQSRDSFRRRVSQRVAVVV